MIYIPSGKDKTRKRNIETIPDPGLFHISLSTHRGAPAVPVVSIGQRIKKHQLIAQAGGAVSAQVHSPASGWVTDIGLYPQPDGSKRETVVIQNDFKETKEEVIPTYPGAFTSEEVIQAIADAGIVGAGGAQFPSHIKYRTGTNRIRTFIINGAECEPYLTADYSLMRQYHAQLLQAVALICNVIQPEQVVLAIEKNNKELVPIFEPYLQSLPVPLSILQLQGGYPQGSELQLIRSATGMELQRGIIPATAGVIVSNVGTLYAIYKALYEHTPAIERIITVSGNRTEVCGNYKVKIGTPISHILQTLGISVPHHKVQLILGGPMMGWTVDDHSVSVSKGTAGILLLEKRELHPYNCIRCGYCVDACPMRLMPFELVEAYENRNKSALKELKLSQCIECGLCEYVCPSDVPLLESFRQGKILTNLR